MDAIEEEEDVLEIKEVDNDGNEEEEEEQKSSQQHDDNSDSIIPESIESLEEGN